MHYVLDIALAVIFLINLIVGYARGFLKLIWKLVSSAISLSAAYFFGPYIGQRFFLELWKKEEWSETHAGLFAEISGYLAVFISVMIIMSIIGLFIKKASEHKVLNAIDRIFGLIFGAALGFAAVFIICVILSLFIEIKLSNEALDWIKSIAEDSYVFRFFCNIAPFEYINIKELFGNAIDQLNIPSSGIEINSAGIKIPSAGIEISSSGIKIDSSALISSSGS